MTALAEQSQSRSGALIAPRWYRFHTFSDGPALPGLRCCRARAVARSFAHQVDDGHVDVGRGGRDAAVRQAFLEALPVRVPPLTALH